MSTSNSIHLFDSAKFFYELHINPHQSVPHWEGVREQIDEFFLDFHDELVERVIMHMDLEEIPALIAIPFSDSVYEHNFRGFSRKDQFLLTGHYLILCCDVKEKIELLQMAGDRQEDLIILHNEITMFIALLNVIKEIVKPHGISPHQDDTTRHCNGSAMRCCPSANAAFASSTSLVEPSLPSAGIVDEAALLTALEDGRVGGAALDVFLEEPPKDRSLASHARVIATPHLGASTIDAQLRVASEVAENIVALNKGTLLGVLNAKDVIA